MFKKRMLIGVLSAICLSLAVPSVALAMEQAIVNQVNAVSFESIDQSPNPTVYVITVGVESMIPVEIEIFEYGSCVEKQVNSNKLDYRESNVFTANFAKVQNQNFESWRLAS